METSMNSKYKHLTFEDRLEIQECLNRGVSFKSIAARIGKDPTTISKEVKKHLEIRDHRVIRYGNSGNKILDEVCSRLLRAPFVCNSCEKKRAYCSYNRQVYAAKTAQKAYEELLSSSREGIPLTKEVFYEMDKIVSDGLKRGQHLYHIIQSNNIGTFL